MQKKVKNIIFTILIFTLFFQFTKINCFASTNTYNREELNNYGVNKKWKITDQNKNKILKTKAVDASEKIYDYADILTDEEENILKTKIDEFINTTKMDMVIVVPDFTYTYDDENEDYAADFYDYNDFGIKFENYSGVLFLRNANQIDPYYNIYTFGNAQLFFNYNRLENVLDKIYPDISSKNYLSGFTDFIDEMLNYYKAGVPSNMKNMEVNSDGYLFEPYRVPWFIITIISTTLTAIIITVLIKKNKMVMNASKATEYIENNSIQISEKQDNFITSHTTSYTVDTSSSSGGGFSSSSGSSGGGHSSIN